MEERRAKGEEGFMLKKDSENKVTDQLIVLRVGLVYLQLGWRRENSTLSSRVCRYPCPMGLLTIDNLLYALWRFGHFLSSCFLKSIL